MSVPMALTGKKLLLAGALSETGNTIASKVIKLGGSIFLTDQYENAIKELSDSLGLSSQYMSFDLSNSRSIELNINEILKVHGNFHGFIYAAGTSGIRPLSMTKPENMEMMMNANCFSFVEFVRCLNKKRGIEQGGSIVAISSVSSIKGLKSKLAYASSKAALDASVRCLAAELGDKGIRVNSILKGGVTTDNKLDYVKNMVQLNDNETLKKQFLGEVTPTEIANMVCFLLSDAVRTMTGASIILDGGYTL